MKTSPWLRVFACGVAFSAGSMLGVQSSGAADDPRVADGEKQAPASKGDEAPGKDDAKPAVETKRGKEDETKSDDARKADSAPSASLKSQIAALGTDAPGSGFALATALLGSLSPEHMKSLGEMLDEDWKERPEWGDMAVAILKSDFMRPGAGWWKSTLKRYDWAWLAGRLDKDSDGKVSRDEFPTELAKRDLLFDRLDRDRDGQLTAADLDFSDQPGGNQAMRTLFPNQLFFRMDKDSNGRVTAEEIAEFFLMADKDELGFLTSEDLQSVFDEPAKKPMAIGTAAPRGSAGPSSPGRALQMFLSGEMGWLTAGPQVDDPAPDFTLPTHDGAEIVKLSDSFGKRPVVLIFGSFT